jgi:serine/threonine-protein kinase
VNSPLQLQVPAHLGRYEIIGLLGQGAMGVVYRARDPIIDRIVALKTIDPHLTGAELADFNERFFHEAKSAGRLNHPNIVTIYDAGEAAGIAYIAMEYLEGPSLRQVLDDHPPLALSRMLEIAAQVARGLAYAHEHGVVHRDVKPANVILVNGRRPKITDFGIARVASAAGAGDGELAGSPKYMSPEQVRREELDGRSDIFSLGTVLYELLTGKQPFTGGSIEEIVRAVLANDPPPPSTLNPKVPAEVDRLVARMMSKRAEDRYSSARRLMRHLAQLAERYAAEEKQRPAGSETETPRPAPARTAGGEETTVVLPVPVAARGFTARRAWALGAPAALVVAAVWFAYQQNSPAPPPAPPIVARPAAPLAAAPAPVASEPPPAVPEPAKDAASPLPPDAGKRIPPPAKVARKPGAPAYPNSGAADEPPLVVPPAPVQTKEVATLQLAVSPWGEIFIDGESRGTSPPLASLQVPPGTYRVEVRNSTLAPYRVDVSVQAGDTRRIKHRFE